MNGNNTSSINKKAICAWLRTMNMAVERSGSVSEWSTGYQDIAGLNLPRGTVLSPWASYFILWYNTGNMTDKILNVI